MFQLSVLHPQPEVRAGEVEAVLVGHRDLSHLSVEQAGPHVSPRQSQQGHLLLGLVLLAVSLVVVVVVVGVLKLRTSARRQQREEQEVEMAWDDAALNITVNPLEVRNTLVDDGGNFYNSLQ